MCPMGEKCCIGSLPLQVGELGGKCQGHGIAKTLVTHPDGDAPALLAAGGLDDQFTDPLEEDEILAVAGRDPPFRPT